MFLQVQRRTSGCSMKGAILKAVMRTTWGCKASRRLVYAFFHEDLYAWNPMSSCQSQGRPFTQFLLLIVQGLPGLDEHGPNPSCLFNAVP